MIRLGVAGAGIRATHLVELALQHSPSICVTVVVDSDRRAAEQRFADAKIDTTATRWFESMDQLLGESSAQKLDGFIVGTKCDSHAEVACKAAELQIPLLLEKPVGIAEEELRQLSAAFEGRYETVVVSFPLRLSPLFKKARDLVRGGRIGKINQITATNFVPYGGVYFTNWYRDSALTGGLWLQKATHDLDYICELAMSEPVGVMAMETQRIFGGDKPEDLYCSQCDLASECAESPQNIALRGDDGGMGKEDHLCAFSSSISNHDAGSAMVMFANGVHAAYSQNFVSRRSAFSRGARITGYDATLTFDWAQEKITVIEHQASTIQTIQVDSNNEDHHGGDACLIRNFLDVVCEKDISHAPLDHGLRSAALCLAARTSAKSKTYESYLTPRPHTRFDGPSQPGIKPAVAFQPTTRPVQ